MAWTEIYRDRSVAVTEPHLVRQWEKRLRDLGFDDPTKLHPFAFRDLAEDLVKHRYLLGNNMGVGKTASAIVGALARDTKHALVVLPNKLIREWVNEFARLGVTDYKIIERLADINGYACPRCGAEVNSFQKVLDAEGKLCDVRRRCPSCDAEAKMVDRLARFNLISFRALWTIPPDSPHRGRPKRPPIRDQHGGILERERTGLKHSFAHVLRRRCELVIVDEAYSLANPKATQTKAVQLLKPRRRWLLTGTPIRGYPVNILSLLTWCLGNGTDLFPDFDATREASVKRFQALFGTRIRTVRPDGTEGHKFVPKISNPKLFQAMLAPVMRRRVNLEPDVVASVKMPDFVIKPEQVELDPTLRTLYSDCVTQFVEWYERAMEEAQKEDTTVPSMTLLSKLGFLGRLAAIPQAIVPSYPGMSSKQARVIELIRNATSRGRRVILLSEYVESVEWYGNSPLLADLKPSIITGSVSLSRSKRTGRSRRDDRLDALRSGDSQLLVSTTPCLAEGLNLPEAGTVIFDSFPWTPSIQSQAWSRVLRPQQKHEPVEIYLVATGETIDDYLSAICAIKRLAIGEGIDHDTIALDLDQIPDPYVYAHSLVEISSATARTYQASQWIERLKAQAAEVQRQQAGLPQAA
jgi:hypothetical protein